MLSDREPRPRTPQSSGLTRLQTAVLGVMLMAIYLLAYRHGQFGRHGEACQCGRAASSMREQEEMLDDMPHSERVMVDCILEQPDTRAAVRQRLQTCLADRSGGRGLGAAASTPRPGSALVEAPRAEVSSPSQAASPLQAGPSTAEASTAAAAAAAAPAAASAAAAFASAVSSVAIGGAADSKLAQDMHVSRTNEDMLPSAPLDARTVEQITAAATAAASPTSLATAAAAAGTLLLITCVGNGKFISVTEKDWLACAGRPGFTPLVDGLFIQEELPPKGSNRVAFKHVKTGNYLQVVPKGSDPAWVVRVHQPVVGEIEAFQVKEQSGSTYLYSLGARCHLNFRFGEILRGHNKGGQPAGTIPSARMQLERVDAAELTRRVAADVASANAARLETSSQISQIATLGASNEVRVISYGLYGASPRYTIGVVRNAELARLVYPGWRVRVYLDHTVPAPVVSELERLGAELVRANEQSMGGGIGGMFWRFLVAADTSVDRFIVRDCDSRLNARERLAVEEWISSGAMVHSLRDHPNHDRPLNGGMWGGRKGAVADMPTLVRKWSNRDEYMGDLDFLNTQIWTRSQVKSSQMAHDAYSCHKYPNSKPFPTRRPPDFQHVGQVFFGDGKPRMPDITDFLLTNKAPAQCRRQPSWENG